MSLTAGNRIDRYEIVGRLGAGGMGEVYRARDTKLERLVALKVLHVSSALEPGGPARLLREARAAAALTHPNVLAIYDVGQVQEPAALRGLPYIAMELVIGKTLRASVGDASLPMEKRIGWLRDIASALGAAHAAGIVHRDVKPENVMIRDDGAVKVLDFGIARRTGAGEATSGTGHTMTAPNPTGAGVVVGTPFYMAPEQLRGEDLDGRADQFAWGVLAYQLLTGESPWKGDLSDTVALVSQILNAAPPAPHDVNARVPAAVSNVIVRAIAKRRERRFASMSEVIAGLDVRSSAEASAASIGERPTARKSHSSTGRHWTRAVARGALGAAMVTGVIAMTVAALKHRRAAAQAMASRANEATEAQCTSNRQCVEAHGGAAWHCHSTRHTCVELASQDCKVYAEPHDAEADDVVWIGGMFPTADARGFAEEIRAANFAREDFASALKPNLAIIGDLHARPIGFVVCDEDADAERAASHLANDAEVPAVLGFFSSQKAVSVISHTFLPNGILSFITISQAPSLTHIPQNYTKPKLVWRSTLNREDLGPPLARFVTDFLEPRLRTGRPFKIAATVPAGAPPEFIESFFASLHFNGQTALANGSNFRQFVARAGSGPDNLVNDILAFTPDVVVFAGPGFYTSVLGPLESRWRQARRPIYLSFSGTGKGAAQFAGQDQGRRRRFFSVTNLPTTLPNAELVFRYNRTFPEKPIVRTEAPQPSYDAFYMLAYATFASPDGLLSGRSLATSIGRLLPPGPTFDVGPSNIVRVFEILRSGGRVNLNGALGPLDYDPLTGEAPVDYAIVCLGTDDHGAASTDIDSGLIYNAKTRQLIGTLKCP